MTGYGAVSTKNPDDENSFEEYYDSDAADLRYVQERPLPFKERMRKLCSAGVPIVVAIILMLGFGWWTTNALTPRHSTGFDHSAIPVPSGTLAPFATTFTFTTVDPDTDTTTKAPDVISTETTSSGSDASSAKTKSRSSTTTKACADNPGCRKLGLVGDCCPTADGVQLGCCL